MSYLDQHYQILGIPPGASVEEVKKAYRKKSMQLHPDVNKHPDATTQFVRLNESYEYLIHALTNKLFQPSLGTFVSRKKDTAPMSYEEWKARCREESQKRAYKQAHEHVNKFKKSRYYRTSYQLGKILLMMTIIACYSFVFGVPLMIMLYKGIFTGLIVLVLINFAALGMHRQIYEIIKEYRRENRYIHKVHQNMGKEK